MNNQLEHAAGNFGIAIEKSASSLSRRLTRASPSQIAELVEVWISRGIRRDIHILAKAAQLGGHHFKQKVEHVLYRHSQYGSGEFLWSRTADGRYLLVEGYYA